MVVSRWSYVFAFALPPVPRWREIDGELAANLWWYLSGKPHRSTRPLGSLIFWDLATFSCRVCSEKFYIGPFPEASQSMCAFQLEALQEILLEPLKTYFAINSTVVQSLWCGEVVADFTLHSLSFRRNSTFWSAKKDLTAKMESLFQADCGK